MRKTLLLLLILINISSLHANIIYVNKNATGSNSGNSWANAYINLQSALTASQSGDQIWVAQGVYNPSTIDITANFSIKNGVSLYGGFIGNETNLSARNWSCNKTVLSGDLSGNDTSVGIFTYSDNSINVVSIISQANIVLDGFTIKGAFSYYYNGWLFERGGIYVWASDNVKILNCDVRDNRANTGGGIAIYGASTAEISNCMVTNNYANDDGGGIDLAFDKNIDIKNCLVANNLCDDTGGGAGSGSGVRIVHNGGSSINRDVYNFENCTIANNLANNQNIVGGVCITNGYARARFKNCIIYGNANSDISYGNMPGAANIDQLINTAVGVNYSNLPATYSANPEFVSSTDFGLNISSPYINAGDNSLSTTTTDLNNNNRINDHIIDLGAYEYGNVASPCSSLGLPDISSNKPLISIFPNPVKDVLTIKTQETLKSIEIFDINGRIVQSSISPQNQIRVSELKQGVYIVKIISENGMVVEKMTKQ